MKDSLNKKRNQLDHYLTEVQDAERKKKRRAALVVLLLATVGIGATAGFFYFRGEKVAFRHFVADDMTIYKMDSLFQKDGSPVILTHRYNDELDTVYSVDEYLSLDWVGDINNIEEVDLDGGNAADDFQDTISNEEVVSNEAAPEVSKSTVPKKEQKKKATTPSPALTQYVFDVAGSRTAGQELDFRIENYDSKLVYVLDFGNGQRQRIRESKSYTYSKSGSYKLRLTASNSKGARSTYTKIIDIKAAPQKEAQVAKLENEAEVKSSSSSSTKEVQKQTDTASKAANNPLKITENPELPPKKEETNSPKVSANPPASTTAPLKFAEKMPSFPGGAASMYKFLNKKLKYPQLARENEVQGKVYVQFLVAVDGSLSSFKVVRGLGFGCDEEALRIAQLMPKWVPGEQGGQKVPVIYTLAVNYKFK